MEVNTHIVMNISIPTPTQTVTIIPLTPDFMVNLDYFSLYGV